MPQEDLDADFARSLDGMRSCTVELRARGTTLAHRVLLEDGRPLLDATEDRGEAWKGGGARLTFRDRRGRPVLSVYKPLDWYSETMEVSVHTNLHDSLSLSPLPFYLPSVHVLPL